MKFGICGFFGFVVSYMFLAALWNGGGVTWITVVGIALSARFILASAFAFMFGYWVQ